MALRYQLAVLQRQIDKPKLTWPDRALLAALLHDLPRAQLRRLQLIVTPDTLLRRHHAKASHPKRPGRPRTVLCDSRGTRRAALTSTEQSSA
ncbi:hypothetical protein ABZ904_47420 [Streptomyces sp. NPDC046900]|uniref:hypothetical protein n=1 Tax=Streptomyces sp. NPDC046900 TaxID=3155473 RepID=UPI0033ECE723